MMKDIAIYGAGGFGREIACLINRINSKNPQWRLIGFFDDNINPNTNVSHYGVVLGGMETLNSWSTLLNVVFAIGNNKILRKLTSLVNNPNIIYPNLIAPDFEIIDEEAFNIGLGNIIQRRSSVSCGVSIGNFNILNGSVALGHDSCIGDFNVLMPEVRISGEVKIGDDNFFGVGSIVLQQLRIGNNVKLAAGSVLMTKPKDGNLYIGVPAKIMKF